MAKKQANGLYRAKLKIGVTPDGSPMYKYLSGRTQRELEQARQEAIAYYIKGTGVSDDRLFGDCAVEWYHVRKEPFISASSRESYRTALNKEILPTFGARQIRAISAAELQKFVNQYAGVSNTRITVIMSALKNIFQAAVDDRILSDSPAKNIKKPAVKQPAEKRALTLEERAKIEEVCQTHPRGAYLAVMYYLGVRPGEARGLRWGDFDWQEGFVHIQRDVDYSNHGEAGALKTHASDRLVPVPAPLRDLLIQRRGLPMAYLFAGERSGGALAKTTAERLWVDLMRECDLVEPVEGKSCYRPSDIRAQLRPLISPHTLRHNYITMCWESGIDVYTTMKLAGHTSIKTTMDIYTHLSDTQRQKAAVQVDTMFSKKEKVAKKLQSGWSI